MRGFFLLLVVITLIGLYQFGMSPNQRSVTLYGGCDDTTSSFMRHHYNDGRKITFCKGGDLFKGKIETNLFPAPEVLRISYAGYPKSTGISYFIENEVGNRFEIALENAGEKWASQRVQVPLSFIGEKIKVVMVDDSEKSFSWAGLNSIKLSPAFALKNVLLLLYA